jgi:hypothetical protein
LEGYLEYYKTVDALVVGANTYAGLAQYWQDAEVSSESSHYKVMFSPVFSRILSFSTLTP